MNQKEDKTDAKRVQMRKNIQRRIYNSSTSDALSQQTDSGFIFHVNGHNLKKNS